MLRYMTSSGSSRSVYVSDAFAPDWGISIHAGGAPLDVGAVRFHRPITALCASAYGIVCHPFKVPPVIPDDLRIDAFEAPVY